MTNLMLSAVRVELSGTSFRTHCTSSLQFVIKFWKIFALFVIPEFLKSNCSMNIWYCKVKQWHHCLLASRLILVMSWELVDYSTQFFNISLINKCRRLYNYSCSSSCSLCSLSSSSVFTIHEVRWLFRDIFKPWRSDFFWTRRCTSIAGVAWKCEKFYVFLLK